MQKQFSSSDDENSFEADLKFASEIYNSRKKSPVNGLPELDKSVLNQFKVISNAKFATLPNIEFTFTYDEKVLTSRGLFIAYSTAIKIGIIQERLMINMFISRITLTYIPRTFSQLLSALETYVLRNSKAYIKSNPNRVCHWLMCFSIYPEFSSYYEEYLLDPDSCVIVIDTDTPKPEIGTTLGAEITFVASDQKITKIELVVSVYLLLISTNKSFADENEIKIYTENHLENLNRVLQITTSNIVFDAAFLTKFSRTMDLLPKLKKKLFYFAYETRSKYRELELAVTVMLKSTMTLVHDILKFIDAEDECKAHGNLKICTEIENFLILFKKKKNEEGLMWPYYRFINPSDTSVILAQYPNLLAAAILYLQFKCTTKYYRDYKFRPTNDTISNLKNMARGPYLCLSPKTRYFPSEGKEIAKLKADLDAIMYVPESLYSIDVIGDDQTINLLKRFFYKTS